MKTELTECMRCKVYQAEVLLLRGEVSGLRQTVLALTLPPGNDAPVLDILGMHEAQRLAIAAPVPPDHDFYRVSLTYRNHLSAQCMLPIEDPSQFRDFFDDLARHKLGWEGEKKVTAREGQFALTCVYEGKMHRPEVSMDVFCALDIPSFDPYWTVQLHLDVDPASLENLAAQARAVFDRGHSPG